MIIKEPSVELWMQNDPVAHVARCARVCYGKKEGKSTDQQLYDNLLKVGHNSMFRHESVYAIIPNTPLNIQCIEPFNNCPYIEIVFSINASDSIYVSTNQNFIIDHNDLMIAELIRKYRVSPNDFNNTEVGHNLMRYTFSITTQISTSRELNRVSPNNIAERSTRYCLEDGVIVRPHWLSKEEVDIWIHKDFVNFTKIKNYDYLDSCLRAFQGYHQLIQQGVKRQDARGILPLDTATEVVYTYSIPEWRHIIALRSDKRAHPNCQIIANMIKKELEDLGYDFNI